jgi:predicted dehydrogenase
MMMSNVGVLVVGIGNMGLSHARAYQKLKGFELVGLVARGIAARKSDLEIEFKGVPHFRSYEEALSATKPDAVSINTWPDTHANYAILAFQRGCHVFLEKPIAETAEDAEAVVAAARKSNKKLVIGYILRVHPSWIKFMEIAKTLGKPLAMRMNLNQQSAGKNWTTHKNLMKSLSPIVDCGVHYVDIMCQVTGAKPVRVHAIGCRLSDEIAPEMYNYGHLHVVFDDGSVGWYEAGWGPMMSEVAYFVKDIIGPKGAVSIVMAEQGEATGTGTTKTASADIDSHTKTSVVRVHHCVLSKSDSSFAKPDEDLRMDDEPGHQELCNREQMLFLDAIRKDLDMSIHMADAVNSLKIVLAADKSVRTGEVVRP